MTKLRREKKLIPQEQKGLGDKGRRRFDTRSTAVSEMSPTPTTRPVLIFKALSPADSTGPLPSSYCHSYILSGGIQLKRPALLHSLVENSVITNASGKQ